MKEPPEVPPLPEVNFKYCQGCQKLLTRPSIGGLCPKCLLAQPPPETWEPPKPPTLKRVIDVLTRFNFRGELGIGAAGAVFFGEDGNLARPVAVKVVTQHPDTPEYEARFWREARITANLNHPNIVTVFDYGEMEDMLFLVMEMMDGGTLEREMNHRGRLSLARAIEVCIQLCAAAEYAHSSGVVHRDIKPANILLDRNGNVKLSDFGLATGRFVKDEPSLTRSGIAVGTPRYMAPEQGEGSASTDQRADVFSIGTVFYEMLTGMTTEGRSCRASKTPGVPRWLDGIVDKALQQDPGKRYQDARSLRLALEEKRTNPVKRFTGLFSAVCASALLASVNFVSIPHQGDDEFNERPLAIESPRQFTFDTFEDEVDLGDWINVARYDFEDGTGHEAYQSQDPLLLGGAAVIQGGFLVLSGIDDSATVQLAYTTERDPRNLAVNFRFRANEFPNVVEETQLLLNFQRRWNLGMFVSKECWTEASPSLLAGSREGLAPASIFESHLIARQWHDVWMVLDTRSYRVWINGEQVYFSPQERDLIEWKRGVFGEAFLALGHFDGLVDHVLVWERQ